MQGVICKRECRRDVGALCIGGVHTQQGTPPFTPNSSVPFVSLLFSSHVRHGGAVSGDDLFLNFKRGVAAEGELPCEHFPKHHSERVHVDLFGKWLTLPGWNGRNGREKKGVEVGVVGR